MIQKRINKKFTKKENTIYVAGLLNGIAMLLSNIKSYNVYTANRLRTEIIDEYNEILKKKQDIKK